MIEKAKNHWLILFLLALAQFMVVLDTSVVNVALPAVQHAFHMSATNLQWIVTAYTLTFGGFLLLGGRAADLYGRKKMFITGVTLFGISSLLDGLAQGGTMLIVLRALQGLSAAFMSPAALSIVLITYQEGHERNIALSIWGAVASGGAAAGVLLGGLLTEYWGWRWNFFVNVPVAIGVVIAAIKMLPAHESEERHNDLDMAGAISITAAMLSLVYGLVEAPSHGWTAGSTLAYLGASLALLAFFIFNERRVAHPLMPLQIFKNRNLTGADLVIFPVMASMFSTFFFGSLYVQDILGYSPVKTGLSFLVIPIAIAVAATNVPAIIKRVGYKPVLIVGPLLIAASLLLLAQVPVDGSYMRDLLPGFALLGLGGGMSFVAATIAATSGVPPRESGLASGLLNTAQQIGGSLGLAILSGVAASQVTKTLHHLPHNLTSPQAVKAYAEVHSFHSAFYVGMCFALGASVVALLIIKQNNSVDVAPDAAAAAHMG